MNWYEILRTWSQIDCVRFAVWCARRVVHLSDSEPARQSIEYAEAWLSDPSRPATCKTLDTSAIMNRTNGSSAYETDLTYYVYRAASYAADAATTAWLARNDRLYIGHASNQASYGAHYAADAINFAAAYSRDTDANSVPAILTVSDLLDIYLSEMVMSEVVLCK